ncbi:MAG: histidine phosphatase family protein [Gammaproteobacteria bacterium]|nr:histidine phosphatase family protein [Gammaproteobacteria bacterium]
MKIDEGGRRTALDGASRRRIYLFRHGSVDYLDKDGNVVPDTDLVDLNEQGLTQASAMQRLFADVHIDRAACSGFPRTRQTALAVLGERDIQIEILSEFEEIRQQQGQVAGGYDIVADIAFSHWRAPDPEARFLGGERYCDFYSRIETAMENLVSDNSWHNLALFAHGGTNAAALGWITGIGLPAFGMLDQATCCLNVIDFDVADSGEIVRKTVRAMNVTAYDPAKGMRHSGDMETLAHWMIERQVALKVS